MYQFPDVRIESDFGGFSVALNAQYHLLLNSLLLR